MKTQFCSLEEKKTFQEYLINSFGASRSQLKKWGLPKKYLAKPVRVQDSWEVPIEILNRGLIAPSYEGPSIRVLGHCKFLMAVSKPPGLHCHPLKYEDRDNVLSWCRAYGYGEVLEINQPHYDRGLAYRLDHGTSGVLILVKDPLLHKWIRAHYQQACRQKKYLAIVKGVPQGGKFIHHLDSSQKKVKESKKGRAAQIELQTLYREKEYSLIEISLREGIRHQIRAQMALLGYPLVGDSLYGGSCARRLFLHAYHYALETPWGDIEVRDTHLSLFDSLLDLNRASEMLGDELFIFKGR